MIFTETPIPGAFLVDVEPFTDDRGLFARTFCVREFAERGLSTAVAQVSISRNLRRSVLRGMHYQSEPHQEVKLVRCASGTIYDVILDLRPDSPAFGKWAAYELTAQSARALYIPAFVAHGFQALSDHAEVHYQISEFFHAQSARGVRWNDPSFAIEWPILPPTLSDRDAAYPDFTPPV